MILIVKAVLAQLIRHNMTDLEAAAKRIAETFHKDQERRYTKAPYIIHIARVVALVYMYTDQDRVLAAAWLHNIHEDTPAMQEHLPDNPYLITLVRQLTNDAPANASRLDKFIHNYRRLVAAYPDAQTIKLCESMANMDDILDHHRKYGVRYLAEKLVLIRGLWGAHWMAVTDAQRMLFDRIDSLTDAEKISFWNHVAVYQKSVATTYGDNV